MAFIPFLMEQVTHCSDVTSQLRPLDPGGWWPSSALEVLIKPGKKSQMAALKGKGSPGLPRLEGVVTGMKDARF